MSFWFLALVNAGALAVFALAGGAMYERYAQGRDAERRPAPGRSVAVEARRLHLRERGTASPTVVIEPGAGEPSRYWWPVADQIAEFARVCTYDRAGFGWSDPAAEPRTIEERARELHGLLTTAGVPGPYVLVAHSYGGFIVRQFARMYPSETAGVVLVDTPEEATIFRPDVLSFYARMQLVLEAAQWAARCGILRLLSRWIALDAIGFPFIRAREYAAAIDDLESLQQVAPAMRGPGGFGTLGDVPLVVLSHGRPFPGPFAILEAGWHDGQVRLAALSQRGELIVAEKSNHLIQLDEPQLVVDAVRRVHALAIGQGGAGKERFVIQRNDMR